MTAPVATGAEGFLARYRGLRARLPGNLAARDAAADSFRRSGLPGRRVEAWKYTDLRPIAAAEFHDPVSLSSGHTGLLARIGKIDAPRLVFVDGRFCEDLSVPPATARFVRFADTPAFGTLANPEREPMVALNTMFAEDGAILDVPAQTDAGLLHLISLASDNPAATDFHPRHAIRLAPNAKLTVLETAFGDGTYLHAPVTEIRVAEGAVLTHIRLQHESTAAFHLATLYADIAGHGTYDSFTLHLGARMARTEIHARLAGPYATTHL
ncbi:MAG: SufD family Fe-S cluster assembly protein, partial [Gemmataceae bacterium]